MPVPRGKNERPTMLSITDDFPALYKKLVIRFCFILIKLFPNYLSSDCNNLWQLNQIVYVDSQIVSNILKFVDDFYQLFHSGNVINEAN